MLTITQTKNNNIIYSITDNQGKLIKATNNHQIVIDMLDNNQPDESYIDIYELLTDIDYNILDAVN